MPLTKVFDQLAEYTKPTGSEENDAGSVVRSSGAMLGSLKPLCMFVVYCPSR